MLTTIVNIFNYLLTRASRKKVLDAYLAIHTAGVEQGDFNDDQTNIMIQELPGPTETDKPTYRPIIIDFDYAQPHVCGVDHKSLRYGTWGPFRSGYPCQEIWLVCAAVEFYEKRASSIWTKYLMASTTISHDRV